MGLFSCLEAILDRELLLIDACAEPFIEWPSLAADLHDPVIIGQAQLHLGDRFIDCTVVRGDYAGANASRSGKRTLWIEDATKTIWQYRVERGNTPIASLTEPSVRIYTLMRQTSEAALQTADFTLHPLDDWVKLSRIPPLRLGDGASLHDTSPPVVLRKAEPVYTEAARHNGIEGTVVLYLEIGSDGAAHNIRVLRSLDPSLDQKAIEAASQWKFRSAMRDGVPVTVAAQIQVNFRLEKKKK